MNVPKLRFKEFTDEWQKKTLDDIISNSSKKYNPLTSNINYPCIELESISSNSGTILNTFNSLKQKSIKNIFKKDDILFGKLRPYLRKYWYANFDGVCSSEIWVFNNKLGLNKYLYYLIQTNKFILIANNSTGSKMPRADWKFIKSQNFYVANIQEQNKIANFLSTVDKKISNLENIITTLEKQKKGLLQQIFNQEIRFKDENGNNYPDWEKKKLGDLFTIKAGGDISKENFSEQYSTEFKYPVYANALTNDGLYGYSNIYKIDKPSITVTGRGINVGFALSRKPFYYPIVRLLVLIPNVNVNFTFFTEAINFIHIFNESTGVPQLTAPQLSKVNIFVPTIKEQNKIGYLFDKLNEKINNQKAQLEHWKQIKKGLLQQMFV